MKYLDNRAYCDDVETALRHTVHFDLLKNKRILVLGATGLIGSFLVDCFLYANENLHAEISIYAVSRNLERLQERFGNAQNEQLHFIEADVTTIGTEFSFDYIIHAASYGHPKAFREIPVEVLLSNVTGTHRVLEIARSNPACRVLYVSSGEAQEEVDHLTPRACYPMGKRAAETLCLCCYQEYGVATVIARPCHTFGANAAGHDNRAAAQFIASAAAGKNIEMYSAGEQRRSFSYVADCASGLMTALTSGTAGTVYGISSGESCTVREFAGWCAELGGCSVEMHLPTQIQQAETSPIKDQIVDNGALAKLGWRPAFTIEGGIERSIRIMHQIY